MSFGHRHLFRTETEVAEIAAAMVPLRAKAEACTACPLAQGRTHVVFGSGSARSGILLIGEAPGATEDATGEPFVGRSGKLLTSLMENAGIARADVYIANVLKCRPPDNRAPRPEEASACAPHLGAQIAALKPRVILALGLSAARWLIPGKAPLGTLRLQEHVYEGIPARVTFHPAAILRNPLLTPEAHADFSALAAFRP